MLDNFGLSSSSDKEFLRFAYATILDRPPDNAGEATYLLRLREGATRLEILWEIGISSEARRRGFKATERLPRKNPLVFLKYSMRSLMWNRNSPPSSPVPSPDTGVRIALEENTLVLRNVLSKLSELETSRQQERISFQNDLEALFIARTHTDLGLLIEDPYRWAKHAMKFGTRDFIQATFMLVLGREAETHEVQHYTYCLSANIGRSSLISILLKSQEFSNRGIQRTTQLQSVSEQPKIQRSEISPFSGAITLATSSNPVVSVIVPVFGKVDYTLRCLRSISEHPPEVAFEVIVIDDYSPDDSVERLSSIRGLRLIANSQNMGFLRTCNIAAEAAHGKFLCFLNNDTEVAAKWLDALLQTFDIFPNTGLAGSKLVYPDGTLQEAGGIIWCDGSAWNFGRGNDPLEPQYNYAREVDYCSGASIMVPRQLFFEVGMFDTRYVPAYCEDSDLALTIRSKGMRVIYQPSSVVVHHEGITSGTSTSSGIKAYQTINSHKQFAKWADYISTLQQNGIDVDRAKDRVARNRILVLEHCTLTPNEDAGSLVVFNILMLLRELGFQCTFIPEDNYLYMPSETGLMQQAGIEVLYAPFVKSVDEHLESFGARYDCVMLFRPVVFDRNIDSVKRYCPNAKIVYYAHDLHFLRMQRQSAVSADNALLESAAAMKEIEFRAISETDMSVVVSLEEKSILEDAFGQGKIFYLPLISAPSKLETADFDERDGLVFVGGYQHGPNVDAVEYFISEVFPQILSQLPDIRLYLVGSKAPPSLLRLASSNVIIQGFVQNLEIFLAQRRINIAPLRYGAGMKGKVLSSMILGLPTVGTSIALEGMDVAYENGALQADTPALIAQAIVRLYTDRDLWERVSRDGVSFAINSFGPDRSISRLEQMFSILKIQTRRSSNPLTLHSARWV